MQIAYSETASAAASREPLVAQPGSSTSRGLPLLVFLDLVRASDFVLLLIGGQLSLYGVRILMAPVTLRGGSYLVCILVTAYTTSIVFNRIRTYSLSRLIVGAKQVRLLMIALGTGTVVLSGTTFLLGLEKAATIYWPILWLAAAAMLTGSARLVVLPIAARWHRTGRLAHRIALLGTTGCAAEFADYLQLGSADGFQITGFYRYKSFGSGDDVSDIPNLGSIENLIQDGQSEAFNAVVVTIPSDQSSLITEIAGLLSPLTADLYFCPFLGPDPLKSVSAFGGMPLLAVAQRPLSDWQVIQKTLIDRIGAAVLLLLLMPLMLVVALVVRLESRGPVLFQQTRIGFNNLPFTCLKFRTMYHEATDALADRQTTRDDVRVTRVGRWLRRLSIDEFPQLVNVLRGDMSLVGPRPHAPNTKADGRLFAEVIAEYAMRHRVKPGITGWAQVNGWRGETATVEQIEQRIWHDLYYIRNWSLWLDIRILLLTVVRGFAGPQAF